jgi:hypothetical protein
MRGGGEMNTFIVLHDSFWKSLIQDGVSLGVIFFGLWFNHELGDSFFANCLLGAMLFIFFCVGGGENKKMRGVEALKEYANSLEEEEVMP